jgi:hypothetical protein
MNEPSAARASLDPVAYAAVLPIPVDMELEATVLPRDHPAWQRDVLSISVRARAVIATLKPLAVRVLGFWDHQLRELRIGGRTLGIDPSGCYRLR